MSTLLRIELIVFAVLALAIVGYTVNRKVIQMKYALIWVIIALGIIITACFPQLAFTITSLVGIETPSNLIFFLAIVSLLGICFSLTIIVSRQGNQIRQLIQQLSIDHYEWKGNDGPSHCNHTQKEDKG